MGVGFLPTEFVDVTATIETKVAMLEAHAEPAHLAARPRWHRRRRADADDNPLPRPAMRRRVRRGFRPLPDLAAGNDPPPASLKGAPLAAKVEFDYDLARFIELPRPRGLRARPPDPPGGAHPTIRIRTSGSRSSTTAAEFYRRFADDLVGRIRAARDEGRTFVAILPVGPMPQYEIAARMINDGAALARARPHVQHGRVRERGRRDGAARPGRARSSGRCGSGSSGSSTRELRPPDEQIHFPTTDAIGDYSARIEDLGGADCCYGGIGWCGHIAFWESHLGEEFAGDLDAYKQAGARLVELHPMTIMQNALHSFGGDWSWVPPKANTIGPREILGARAPQLLARRRPRRRRLLAALHRAPRRARPGLRVRPGLDPADGPDRLHDPRRRRRRRRDPHGLTEAIVEEHLRAFGTRTWTRAGAILLVCRSTSLWRHDERLARTSCHRHRGASGIGRGIASVLASEGAHVVVADIDTRRAAEAASELASTEGGATSIEVDVRDQESVKAMADATLEDKERIDILCSNAGIYLVRDAQRDDRKRVGQRDGHQCQGRALFDRSMRSGDACGRLRTDRDHVIDHRPDRCPPCRRALRSFEGSPARPHAYSRSRSCP